MRWLARVRMVLVRHRWVSWTVVAALAATAGLAVASAMRDVQRQRDAWGHTMAVAVAAHDIAPGAHFDGDAVVIERLPQAVVPAAALHEVPSAATALHAIAAGEIVVGIDVAVGDGPAALLPRGTLGVSIALERAGLTMFHVGDRAALLADGHLLSADGTVVAVQADGSAVVVAVPAAAAADVADAVSRHTVVLALAPAAPG